MVEEGSMGSKFSDYRDIGRELQNPLDLCMIEKTSELVVADEANGIVVYEKKGREFEFSRHLKEFCDAGSVAYSAANNKLYASICRQPDSLKQLVEIDCESWQTCRTLDIPTVEKMRSGFIHWVACGNGSVYVVTGDNKIAVIWSTDVDAFSEWSIVLQTVGDLEHPVLMDSESMIVAAWTQKEDWCIKEIKVAGPTAGEQKIIVPSMPGITQPWSFAYEDGRIIAYDYETGVLAVLNEQNGQYVVGDSPAKIPFGQWVSMKIYGGSLYVTCSDERVVRVFS